MYIFEVYQKYKIMPQLQLHMLRVAAVAQIISENMTISVDTKNIVTACLLHDMGNIIKFDLTLYPKDLEPYGLIYWENIKQEFINKYGNDEHEATYKIVEEIKVTDRTKQLVHSIGFSKAIERYNDDDISKKICMYSDHRVSPHGVLSLEERIKEGLQRFLKNKEVTYDLHDISKTEELSKFAKKVEEQIFTNCRISPEDINDGQVNKQIPNLKSTDIELTPN